VFFWRSFVERSSDMIDAGGVEFDESVVDNSNNLLVD
jgi:hypothetical protein